MTRRAVDGIRDLIDRTGGAKVEATVTVNQPYAQDQHETLYYKHPRGGRAKYLESPLYESHRDWIQSFANRLLGRNRNAAQEWGGVGRDLKNTVPKNAPVEFGDLRQSAALVVKEGAQVVIDEPPIQPRLTDAELDAKDYMRDMGVSYR